ncbi:MAG: hypothetical protein GC179_28540 [Anaerolineaceae bacterium]|nr:hypothetical protein [Anaerolineaceae bacterium]
MTTKTKANGTVRAADDVAVGEGVAQNNGVINPYALAEVIADRKIPWKELPDAPRVLEDILQTPYEELFDPAFEGPLYTGLKLNSKLELVPERSPLLDVEINLDINDLENPLTSLDIKKLADLGPRFNVKDVGTIEVTSAELVRQQYLQLTVRLPDKERLQSLARVLSRDIVATISHDPKAQGNSQSWTPPNATWTDPGRFFNEGTEFFDPVQGAVANCYYIAALASVAWAKPFQIAQMTRATGTGQQSFVDMVRFYKPDSGGVLDKQIEVTETVPQTLSGNFIYARSSEAGEIWPSVYEKAYAKLKTGTSSDHPDITATAWGDCVWATAQLTGGRRYYYDTASRSSDTLWDLVRGNSLSYRTFNPMTAWTYSTGDANDRHLNYSGATIVASHCYSVLGWGYYNSRKYIVLRNPWGNTEATVATLNATISMYDISWWRPITLNIVDGTFAMEAWAFKYYFAGLGVAK